MSTNVKTLVESFVATFVADFVLRALSSAHCPRHFVELQPGAHP